MTKISELTNGAPSQVTREQNHYEKIRLGSDPEYSLAQRGAVFMRCGDIALNGVWNQEAYRFLKQPYPENFNNGHERFAAVHPSLWSNGRNNQLNGIFEVIECCIYQVRGYDMANISFVKTPNGWLILDTLMSEECTYAALSLAEDYFKTLGEEYRLRGRIKGVIISHSHVDHFGGVKAVCGYNLDGDKAAGKTYSYEELTAHCPIYAPAGFTEASVSENAYAGNAMGRRASYQYGSFIKPRAEDPEAEENWRGSVSIGIGQGQSTGTVGFLKPTNVIKENTDSLKIDGLVVCCQLTPGTEAPAEMNHYFPKYQALWMAENCAGTLHNLYTLRGAQVRDGNAWAKYLVEAAQKLRLPYALEHNWNLKPYYGTPSHDAKAVYQRYMGWYDANPINLNPLSPEERAKAMAGYLSCSLNGKNLKGRLECDLGEGKYRTVADFTYQIYLAGGAGDCDADTAKELCSKALRQLAYVSESGPWRNCYLSAAWELDNGKGRAHVGMGADLISNMEPYMLLDYIGILYDGDRSVEYDESGNRREKLEFIADIAEGGEKTRFHVYIRNGSILYYQYKQEEMSEPLPTDICHFSISKKDLIMLLAPSADEKRKLDERIYELRVGTEGEKYLNMIFYNLVNLKNDRYQTFDIVTPHDREFLTRSGKRVNLRKEAKECIRMMEGHLVSISYFGDYDLLAFDADGMDAWIKKDGFYKILVEEAQAVEDTTFFAPAPVGTGKRWQNNLGIGPDGLFCKYEYAQVMASCYRFLAEPYFMGADHKCGDGDPVRVMYLKKAILLLEPYLNRYRQNFNYDTIIAKDIMEMDGNDNRAWSELTGKLFSDPVVRLFKDISIFPNEGIVYGRQLAYTLYLLYRELYRQYGDGDLLNYGTERKAVLKEKRSPH